MTSGYKRVAAGAGSKVAGVPRASATLNVRTGHELVVRESDGATCLIVWLIGEAGSVLDVRVIINGEDE